MKKIIAMTGLVVALSACTVDNGKVAERATATAKPSKTTEEVTAGTYVVPKEIKPGTYKTDGAGEESIADGVDCYWARLKDVTGDMDAIIANANFSHSMTITIKKTDGAIELSGPCVWRRVK